MAIGQIASGSANAPGGQVAQSSVQSGWVVANTDLQTADTAALLKPYLITRAAFSWVRVPFSCTRVLLKGRNLATMSATGTPGAVVRVIVARGTPDSSGGFSGVPGNAAFAVFDRVDNVDANAAGVTLTFATTTNMEDTVYEYTDPVDLTGVDLKAGSFVGMLVETACAVTGSAAVDGMFLFMN